MTIKKKNRFLFSRAIKLGPALGDWTKLKLSDKDDESVEVSVVDSTNFDSLSKSDLKKVHHIHHTFARMIAEKLSKDMNIKIELHTIMVTQVVYSDFVNSINNNVFQVDLSLPDMGRVNMIFGANLASMIVDRLLGGNGDDSNKGHFTEVEREVLNAQIQELIPTFQNVWGDILNLSGASLSLYSGKYKIDNSISYRESYTVFTFYLYFGDGELLRFMVAYPNEVLRKLIRLYDETPKVIAPNVELNDITKKKIYYDVCAELGGTILTMEDIRQLRVNDVIPLDKTVDSLVKLRIGDTVQLYGQPCVYKDRLSCQIVLGDEQFKNSIQFVSFDEIEDSVQKTEVEPVISLPTTSESTAETSAVKLSESVDESFDEISSDDMSDFIPSDIVQGDPLLDATESDNLNIEETEDEEMHLDDQREDDFEQLASASDLEETKLENIVDVSDVATDTDDSIKQGDVDMEADDVAETSPNIDDISEDPSTNIEIDETVDSASSEPILSDDDQSVDDLEIDDDQTAEDLKIDDSEFDDDFSDEEDLLDDEDFDWDDLDEETE
tara:strand:- start:3729 stop:5390 length:1662 start_codon:yes stop_codon:yes gene_type:complete